MQQSGRSASREGGRVPRVSFRGARSAGPESIIPVLMFIINHCHREYGFRACAKGRIPE
jgi:hypothetical protein